MSPAVTRRGDWWRRVNLPDELRPAPPSEKLFNVGSPVIITFRMSADEFEGHIAHRKDCSGCDDLAHLYLTVAELAYVKVFVDRYLDHPPPNQTQLASQLVHRALQLSRRRRTSGIQHARQRRGRLGDNERDNEALRIIRRAWDRQG